MGLEIGINLLKDVFMNTSMFGNYWIYQLLFLFGTLVLITRNWKDWGDLALPIVTGWNLIGFHFNYIFFAVTGMVFVINAVSMKEIVGGLTSVQSFVGSLSKKSRIRKAYDAKVKAMEEKMEISKKYTPLLMEKALKERRKEKILKEKLGIIESGKPVTIKEAWGLRKKGIQLRDEDLRRVWQPIAEKAKKKWKKKKTITYKEEQ